jgi:predicted nucleic acid-binding protein
VIRRPSGYLIDANLLVLLAVGNEGRDFIAKHRRLDEYSAADYDILIGLLRQVSRVLVTPNTLTEASNLLSQHGEPERSRFMGSLRDIIVRSEEIVVDSTTASANNVFATMGLTDAALVEIATAETPVLTVDADLHRAALIEKPNTTVNFANLRDQ